MTFFAKHAGLFGKASSLFLALELVFFTVSPALAIKFPSASSMAADLENRYHMNTGTLQNISENLNVDANKQNTPQMTIFFTPTDPKPGQKITAKALPMYFNNRTDQLYYTWYIKHKGCDLGRGSAECDADRSENVTVNDWKVAAMKIIAQSGFDPADVGGVSYAAGQDTDGDGYSAHFGGNDQVNKPNRCYIHDSQEGKSYELSKNSGSFSCGKGTNPVCVVQATGDISSGSTVCNPFTGICGGDTFIEGAAADQYNIVGTPLCSSGGFGNSGTISCSSGSTACAPADSSGPFTAAQLGSRGAVSCTYDPTFVNNCTHLFADPKGIGEKTGDASFGVKEEEFWGTNPKNSSTADNGNKDEANVAGLGQDSFTWNYQSGDQVGVVVEGISMIPTKQDDSSSMIMFAFSKNKCTVTGKSSYVSNIRGYNVTTPTSNMSEGDLNGCLEQNLVDPTEGGQAKKIEINVTSSHENPVNDETEEEGGDILMVQADVNNSSRPVTDDVFTWKVEVSGRVDGGWQDITKDLQDAGLLSSVNGNGLATLPITLNMQPGTAANPGPLRKIGLNGVDLIYLRVTVRVEENFNSTTVRSGKSDVIVRVSNTDKKIVAYTTTVPRSGADDYRVALGDPVCNSFTTPSEKLDKVACRVAKNEIIGLKVDGTGLSNFQWSINGTPLTCSKEVVSNECGAAGIQNEEAFFAVAGNPGDTYTIQMNATDAPTGKSVTLSRAFQIVDPIVEIVTADEAQVWPMYLGEYQALDGTTYSDFSRKSFNMLPGSLRFKAQFIPSFVGANTVRTWTVDGMNIQESAPFEIQYAPAEPKLDGGIYSVGLSAVMVQSIEKRRALESIWGISALGSQEVRFSQSVQATVTEADDLAKATGSKKFFATVSQYLPSSIAFAFRLMLTIALLIFTMGFVFALVPETSGSENEEVIVSRRK
jgi:hypothetical protein